MNCYLCHSPVITEDHDGYGFWYDRTTRYMFHSECLEMMGLETEPETKTSKPTKITIKGEEDEQL